MKYEKIIEISKEQLTQIDKYLTTEPTCEDECFGENETITNTAVFPDNIEMDVKCCGVRYDENATSNTAYTEAVLFKNGCEVCCSEPSDEYAGIWTLEYNNNEYTIIVEEKN